MGSRRDRSLCNCASWLRGTLRRLATDERGQATVEYILILSATVIGAGFMSRKIIQVLDTGIVKLGGQMEKDLKTGRAPLSVWKN